MFVWHLFRRLARIWGPLITKGPCRRWGWAEDEVAVRRLPQQVLELNVYTVLEAVGGTVANLRLRLGRYNSDSEVCAENIAIHERR